MLQTCFIKCLISVISNFLYACYPACYLPHVIIPDKRHGVHSEEVGQQAAKHHGYWAPNSTRGFIDYWLSRSEHLSKPIWKLSNDKVAILCEKKQHLIAVLLRSSLWLVFYYTKFTFFKLHGTCCHFSLININASERRKCVYNFIFPIARLFLLTWMTLNLRVSSTWKQAQYLRLVYYNALQLSCYLVKLCCF
jgi:hypothetical protein